MKRLGGLLGAVAGVIFLCFCLFGYVRGHSTDDWVATEGTVASFSLEKSPLGFLGRGRRRGRSSGRSGWKHRARIMYQYQVDDLVYSSYRHHIGYLGFSGTLTGSKYYLENVADVPSKFSPGTQITVHYDPDDPQSAVIEKGYQGFLPTLLLFGGIIVISGVAAVVKS